MESSGTTISIRTRFAPSPTGPLHMGSVRTALFNYLLAKQQGGSFILRIEDTDKERSKPEWEKDILDNFEWLGLSHDEGPVAGGPYGPYRQSERTEMYKKYLLWLLEQGRAYYCFCTAEELEAQKQMQLAEGKAPKYLGTCRNLSLEQVRENRRVGKGSVIRFLIPEKKLAFQDLIRGTIEFDTSLFGDTVIAKDLESPLYNFSVVIDDYVMHITHVVRGEEHIPNTPKQILLQEALGFPHPKFAHLPLILAPDKTKLSKRHGDNSIAKYRKQGYLPEAVLNFLALLGWNPGTDRELFTLDELVKEFSIKRVQKGGAIFNITRLDWLNGSYIRNKSKEELILLCLPFLLEAGFIEGAGPTYAIPATGEEITQEKLVDMVELYRDRIKVLCDIKEFLDFFFVQFPEYEKNLLQWKDASDKKTKDVLQKLEYIAQQIPDKEWTQETLSNVLMAKADEEENRGYLLWPLRAALTGKKASAGPFEIATLLGKEKTIVRIQHALQKF